MYNEKLNSDFCNFISEKVQYSLYITITEILENELFNVITHTNFYEVRPLFNFNHVISTNPKDKTENNKVLILQKNNDTMLSFISNQTISAYKEIITENTIDNIKYRLYHTYDEITGEPAPYKQTSNGNITDKNGYYMDSEIIEEVNIDDS